MAVTYRIAFFIVSIAALIVIIPVHSQDPSSNPIPNPRQPDGATYFGNPAQVQPITTRTIPGHPFMYGGESSNIHNDAYMSDTYTHAGPLGIQPEVTSIDLGAICATITFDSHGRIITTCLNLTTATLFVLNADTLEILDSLELPYREVSLDDIEFPAGSYFYLDTQERIVLPVVGNEIWHLAVTNEHRLVLESAFDLSGDVPDGDEINSILPDFEGLLWFTTLEGVVGTIDTTTQTVQILPLEGEKISNSFAVDETGGVFIVTNTAFYRFDADDSGKPVITWREVYDRGTAIKPGQVSQGSGTTPTIMGEDYVVITDNAEPQMQVLVYRRAADVADERLVCSVPVFPPGRSATENSVIATDQSIIVENNYGYVPLQMAAGILSEPGLTRIDVTTDGICEIIWTSEERIPTAVTKLSLATGLIYTYTRDEGNILNASWWLTAIDFATGETVWEQYVGTGLNFNNNYAAVYLGQDSTAYVGVTGGIVAIRDTE